MDDQKLTGIEAKLSEGSILKMAARYQQLFDEVEKRFPDKNIVEILYAASCRAGNLSHLSEDHKVCISRESCPYQTLFDGDKLCLAENLHNGYEV